MIGSHATGHAGGCLQALQSIGERGFGANRVRASLCEVDFEPPPAAAQTTSAWQVVDAALAHPRSNHRHGLRLRFVSPLRIKHGGELVRDVPRPELLMQRLLGRLVLLLPRCDGGLFDPGEREGLLHLAAEAPLLSHRMGGIAWERYSTRQQRAMPFEGLLGSVEFGAPAGMLYPWFALAEWLHLGAKPVFGFGVVEAEPV